MREASMPARMSPTGRCWLSAICPLPVTASMLPDSMVVLEPVRGCAARILHAVLTIPDPLVLTMPIATLAEAIPVGPAMAIHLVRAGIAAPHALCLPRAFVYIAPCIGAAVLAPDLPTLAVSRAAHVVVMAIPILIRASRPPGSLLRRSRLAMQVRVAHLSLPIIAGKMLDPLLRFRAVLDPLGRARGALLRRGRCGAGSSEDQRNQGHSQCQPNPVSHPFPPF